MSYKELLGDMRLWLLIGQKLTAVMSCELDLVITGAESWGRPSVSGDQCQWLRHGGGRAGLLGTTGDIGNKIVNTSWSHCLLRTTIQTREMLTSFSFGRTTHQIPTGLPTREFREFEFGTINKFPNLFPGKEGKYSSVILPKKACLWRKARAQVRY